MALSFIFLYFNLHPMHAGIGSSSIIILTGIRGCRQWMDGWYNVVLCDCDRNFDSFKFDKAWVTSACLHRRSAATAMMITMIMMMVTMATGEEPLSVALLHMPLRPACRCATTGGSRLPTLSAQECLFICLPFWRENSPLFYFRT